MKRFTLMTLVALLMMAFATTASAAPIPCTSPNVASFDFLVDYSGSMMMKHKVHDKLKFEMAREAVARVNDLIPVLGYSGSLHTFATDMEIVPQQPYGKEAIAAGIASLRETYEVFARLTPMGEGIAYWSNAVYSAMPGPAAVIIVSDGENNRGIDAVAAAQAALAANPNLNIHVISTADTVEGQAVLDSIVALKPGNIGVKAEDIISCIHNAEEFTRKIFCGGNKIVLRSVQFAFDSAEITAESAAILDEVSSIIKHSNSRVTVSGHTCSIGSDQYNQRLSERRAASVKAYLVQTGVASNDIVTRGYGESQPKFDNSTEEGRRLNRRAEIDFN